MKLKKIYGMKDSKSNIINKEARRKKALGELGKLLGIKALVDNGFTNIKNLNGIKRNYTFADLYAEKDNKKYAISIKTRNKFQENGKENMFYNLGKNVYLNSERIAEELKAEAFWMAIPFNENSYSVYLGGVKELNNKHSIPIRKCKIQEIGVCLVQNVGHYFDWDFFRNKRERIAK